MKHKLPKNYDPVRRKYLKLCPVCEEDLWARKNQEYHPECKVWLNNHKAALYREAVKEDEKIRKHNYKILKLLTIIEYLNKPILRVILEAVGLNFVHMTKLYSGYAEDIYETCGYRLKSSGMIGNKEVIITKIKNDEK